jgi:hypothetical protein
VGADVETAFPLGKNEHVTYGCDKCLSWTGDYVEKQTL